MQQHLAVLRRRAWPVSKTIFPLAIAAVCLWMLAQRLGRGDIADIRIALAQIGAGQWLMAALATAVSFWAVGRYDVVIHRHIGTGCDARQTGIVGAASVALGQVLGMGVLVGALVRWRMLPDLSPVQATRIALCVTGWFFFGLAGVVALVALTGPAQILPASWIVGIILLFICIVIRCFLKPNFVFLGRRFRLLSLPATGRIICLTLVDTGAAALALWLLMPLGVDAGFAVLFPAYLAALAAALITGTPGGVGPFELTLLALLPHWPEAELMAGIVAFRLVYYALPGVIAMGILCRPFGAARRARTPGLSPASDAMLQGARRAELGVCRQNGAGVLSAPGAALAVTTTPQAQVALFDPLQGRLDRALPALLALARDNNRSALAYKVTARHAAPCRRAGMKALHIADEAVINPGLFTTRGASFRQLRRKLRQAEKAGITVRRTTALPIPQMRAIDAEWQARNGRARGFSMGGFCPDYLRGQRVYLACQADVPVAFASFHASDHDLCLDLMRAGADAPDGTMHQLICAAIHEAAEEGRTTLSLAALPPHGASSPLVARAARLAGGAGLTRFKMCFAPRRVPLYALARSWPGMALSLADVARAVHWPESQRVHIDDEENGFAHARQT